MPGIGEVHVSEALSNFAFGYKSPVERLTTVFPVVPSSKENNTFYKFQAGDFYRDEAAARAPDAEFTYIDWNYSTDTFHVTEYSAAKRIADRTRRQADPAISRDIAATKRVMDKLAIKRERLIATLLETAGNWTSTAACGGSWDLGTGSPIDEVETGVQTVQGLIGMQPNTMVLNWKAYRALRKHPQILERLGISVGSGTRAITPNGVSVVNLAVLSEIFDIPRIVVSDGIYNSAAKGQAATLTQMMTDNVWIGYAAGAAALDEPTAGIVIETEAPHILQWREAHRTSDVVGGLVSMQAKATGADAGYTITNVLS